MICCGVPRRRRSLLRDGILTRRRLDMTHDETAARCHRGTRLKKDDSLATDLDILASLLGPTWWRPPLFYKHRFALRFELGQGEFWMDRVATAKSRATTIAEAAFDEAEDLRLVVVRYLHGKAPTGKERRSFTKALDIYELPPATAFETLSVPPSIDASTHNEQQLHVWLGVTELSRNHIDRVLWASVVGDYGFLPRPPASRHYILSLSNGLVLHPYDDRGMDVVASTRSPLQSLYGNFGDWLLDYDKPRMNEVFGGCPGDGGAFSGMGS